MSRTGPSPTAPTGWTRCGVQSRRQDSGHREQMLPTPRLWQLATHSQIGHGCPPGTSQHDEILGLPGPAADRGPLRPRPDASRLAADIAGSVEAVGKKVTKFQPGDEVFGGLTNKRGSRQVHQHPRRRSGAQSTTGIARYSLRPTAAIGMAAPPPGCRGDCRNRTAVAAQGHTLPDTAFTLL
jgi:hypothetical protein